MKKYRKKLVIVEAERWDGEFDICQKCKGYSIEKGDGHGWLNYKDHLNVGEIIFKGDYIVKDQNGEYHELNKDIFEETYDEI